MGRDEVLTHLEDLVAPTTGRGLPEILIADAGLGKSRLLQHAASRARANGLWVLQGRAIDGDAAEGLRSLREALGRVDLEAGCQPGDRLWVAWQSALRALDASSGSPTALAEELIRFLRMAARRTSLVLVLDDLQWADPDELAVLTYLIDNREAHGARLLLSARADAMPPALARLVDRRVAAALPLPPLPPTAVRALVGDVLGVDAVDRDLMAFVVGRAGGSPFAVEELLSGLIRSGVLVANGTAWRVDGPRLQTVAPPTVAASLHRRLAALSPNARAVVHAAAVLGHEFDWELIGPVTALDAPAVAAGLREAADAGVIIESDSALRFRHALTRDEVVRTMLTPERRSLARAALDVVRSASDGSDAHHDLMLALAEDADDLVTWHTVLLRSGVAAANRGDLGAAIRRLDSLVTRTSAHAVDAATVAAAAAALSEVHGRRGDRPAAENAARLALASSPDAATTRRVREALVRVAIASGDLDVAEVELQPLVNAPTGARNPHTAVLEALIRLGRGDLPGAVDCARDVADDAAAPYRIRCEAFDVLGRASRTYDIAEAARWFERALEIATDAHDPHASAGALHELGTIDLLDNLRVDRLESARAQALTIGDPHTIAHADFHLAEAYAARSESLLARRAADRAIDVAARIGSPVLAWAWLTTARTYAHDRDDPAMDEAIARARAAAGPAPEPVAIEAGVAGRVNALRALFGADRVHALAHLDAAATLLADLPGHHFPHWGLWALLRAVHAPLTDADRARVRGSAGAGTRANRALLTAADAVDAGRRGERDRARREFAVAELDMRGYDSIDWLIHLTRWIVSPEARRDGWGEPVTWAQEGVRWFSEHHQEPLATSCRQTLRQLGAPVPRRGRGSSQVPAPLHEVGVTSREVDVLVLIALRLSNSDIADRLVLSPRTVERHVSSLLSKTGTSGRRDLALLAERHGLA